MIFYANSEGTIFKTYPNTVYQGSADASKVVFVAPFSESNVVTVAFQLPHGFNTEPYVLINQGFLQDNGSNVELEGEALSVWMAEIPAAITKYAGVVKAQFYVMSNAAAGSGVIVSTSQTAFTVQKGVAAVLPGTPNSDVYAQMLSQLNAILAEYTDLVGGIGSGEYAARSITPWLSYKTYGAGEYVIRGATNNVLYYSDTAPGNAIPGEETTTPPHWRKIFAFDDVLAQLAEISAWDDRITQAESDIDTLQSQVTLLNRDNLSINNKLTYGQQVGADSITVPGASSTGVMYTGRYYFFRNGTENYIMRAKVDGLFSSPFTADGIDETKWEVVYNLGELTDTVIDAVKEFIDQISGSSFEIVPIDPATGFPDVETPSKNIIYLTAKTDGSTEDSYDEWIYTNNKWERIGSTDIDLSAYVTKTELNGTLSSYVTQTLLSQTLQNYVTSTVLAQTLSSYATKEYVDNAVSSASVSKNEIIERGFTSVPTQVTDQSSDFIEVSGNLYVKVEA